MNAGECHGDVIFWPLKSVADYLTASNHYAILEEIIPYADNADKQETLFAHIKAAVSQIQSTRFIPSTGLITYAGGDWDDTLQPAQPQMREKLVSVWTQALAYQTFHLLGVALKNYNSSFALVLNDLAITTKFAFSNYAIKDDVIAGFLEWDDCVEYLLHPSDTQTGIHYRLLPQTRSIIAELVDKPQAMKNISVIHTQLECPDGVRLMDAPASYDGGISHLFKRAEQATNIGREISLQYTHAHIRYIEAMAKYGNPEEAWNGLFCINPILIQQSVQNATLRQSNMYFSSSDGDYLDRYEYQKNFGLLRTGSIPVKGGWRLYSSGPGIYMHQMISHILGIRFEANAIIIDPILPSSLGSFDLQLECFEETCHFHYRKSDSGTIQLLHNGQALTSTRCENPYRTGGIKITKEDFIASDSKEYTIMY
jgi:cellobiose phosphorylase